MKIFDRVCLKLNTSGRWGSEKSWHEKTINHNFIDGIKSDKKVRTPIRNFVTNKNNFIKKEGTDKRGYEEYQKELTKMSCCRQVGQVSNPRIRWR